MTDLEIQKDNELIHHFVGGKWNVVRFTQGGHWEIINGNFKAIPHAQRVCDRINSREKPNDHYHVAPAEAAHVYHYHRTWNSLMPVVEKIESFYLLFSITTDGCYITSKGVEDEFLPWMPDFPEGEFGVDSLWQVREHNYKLVATWKTCVMFIKWYNTKTS